MGGLFPEVLGNGQDAQLLFLHPLEPVVLAALVFVRPIATVASVASGAPGSAWRRVGKVAHGLAPVQVALNQSRLIGHRSRLYPIRHVQSLEERGDVDLDGLLGKTKRPTDFLVRTALAKKPQHVDLSAS